MKLAFFATALPCIVVAVYLYFTVGTPFSLMVLGAGFILPGIFGFKLEGYVKKIDREYPNFLKALGEHMASTSNLKESLSYVIHMELGSLDKLVRRALARLKLGISHSKTLGALSTEAASYQVHMSNQILLDSLNRGANALKIGNALGNRVVAFMENRRKREMVAKSFQMIMIVMQGLTVVLLVVLRVLSDFLSASLVGLPYFGFNEIPVVVIEIGNLALVLTMAVMNALIIKEASAGYWGTFFFNLAILLILSGVGWIVADSFVRAALGSMPAVDLPV
jgi:archaellum biogenesis protein FlaJ (TadC family)